MINEGAKLVIHDPKVNPEQIANDLGIDEFSNQEINQLSESFDGLGSWTFNKNLEIFDDAYAVLILTEWPEYGLINWEEVAEKMIQPAWIFDSRSIIDSEKVKKAELNLWRVGDGS